MDQPKPKSSPVDKPDYWTVRLAIIKAAQQKDDDALKALAKLYPGIFQNVLNHANNMTRGPKSS